ncbi:hypothetical protein BWR19_04290 [Halomonas sp. 1513]|nr:hypothetical protein BWR19_04290 [Halomonas sp. 1513]
MQREQEMTEYSGGNHMAATHAAAIVSQYRIGTRQRQARIALLAIRCSLLGRLTRDCQRMRKRSLDGVDAAHLM